MGYPTGIGKVYVKAQSSGWGTAETSFSASDTIGANVVLPPLTLEALASEIMRGGFHAQEVKPGSREGAELTISHVLQGVSSTTPTADPTANPDVVLLESVLGGKVIGGYSSGDLSGGTASSLEFTDGQIAAALSGQALLVPLAGSLRGFAWAETVDLSGDPDTIAPIVPLAAAPDASGTPVVYGSAVLYLSTDNPTPFTVQWIGSDPSGNAGVRFSDCVCTAAKAVIIGGQLAKIDYTVKAGYWEIAGGAAPSTYVLSHPELPAVFGANGGRYYSENAGATVTVPQIEIDITAEMVASRDINATDGFAAYDCTNREVMVTETRLSSDMTSEISDVGAELAAVQLDLCTTPGRAWSALVANAQVAQQQTYEDGSGMVVQKTVYKCRPHTSDTAGGDAANSAFRLAAA